VKEWGAQGASGGTRRRLARLEGSRPRHRKLSISRGLCPFASRPPAAQRPTPPYPPPPFHCPPYPLRCPAPVSRAGWITKINLFSDGKCVVGIKPTYGYSASGAQLLGREGGGGQGSDFVLYPHNGEFVTKVEARVGDK
jgi:hypothetical protein